MLASVVMLALGAGQAKSVCSKADFERLFAKVEEAGQSIELEKNLSAFFFLSGAKAVGYSHYDSERQVVAVTVKSKRVLVFVVPEKPFPEFGKTWAYRAESSGELNKGGVCEPRQPFARLGAEEALKGAKAECGYWLKELFPPS